MVNEYMFNEIMQMQPSNKKAISITLEQMMKYCQNIQLLMTEKNEVFYRVDANFIKQLNIESSDLLALNQSGWVLSENKKYLDFFI